MTLTDWQLNMFDLNLIKINIVQVALKIELNMTRLAQ